MKNSMHFLKKSKIELLFDSAISVWGVHPKEMKSVLLQNSDSVACSSRNLTERQVLGKRKVALFQGSLQPGERWTTVRKNQLPTPQVLSGIYTRRGAGNGCRLRAGATLLLFSSWDALMLELDCGHYIVQISMFVLWASSHIFPEKQEQRQKESKKV